MAVTYTGRSDVREFTARDLKDLGVEGSTSPLRFKKGVAQEVDEELANILATDARVSREFKVDVKPEQPEQQPEVVSDDEVVDTGSDATSSTDSTSRRRSSRTS